jgi:hypothetical protein
LFCLAEPCQIDFWAGRIGQVKNLFIQLNSSHGWILMHRAQKNRVFNVTARHGWPLPKSILGLNKAASIRTVTSLGEPCPKKQCI